MSTPPTPPLPTPDPQWPDPPHKPGPLPQPQPQPTPAEEMAQQDADVAEDARVRGALDVALMNFNARCELRGFGKWELMPVKEKK